MIGFRVGVTERVWIGPRSSARRKPKSTWKLWSYAMMTRIIEVFKVAIPVLALLGIDATFPVAGWAQRPLGGPFIYEAAGRTVCPRILPLIATVRPASRRQRRAFDHIEAQGQPRWTEVPAERYRGLLRQFIFVNSQVPPPGTSPSRAEMLQYADRLIAQRRFRLWEASGIRFGTMPGPVSVLRFSRRGWTSPGYYNYLISEGLLRDTNVNRDHNGADRRMFIYRGFAYFASDLGQILTPYVDSESPTRQIRTQSIC
jgi:hypothetical protein